MLLSFYNILGAPQEVFDPYGVRPWTYQIVNPLLLITTNLPSPNFDSPYKLSFLDWLD